MGNNVTSQIMDLFARGSGDFLHEQFRRLRMQIPLMYGLMSIFSGFLCVCTYGDVPFAYSVGMPVLLNTVIAARTVVWLARRRCDPNISQIRRYLAGLLVVAILISAAFGCWGFLLLTKANYTDSTAIALFVFISAISCCYCLQAFPAAAFSVMIFGALPVTLELLFSGDSYLSAVGLAFVFAAFVILRSLISNYSRFREIVTARGEMRNLINALEISEEHHRHSVDLNPQIPWICDRHGLLIEISNKWSHITGLEPEAALGSGWAQAVHPADLAHVKTCWAQTIAIGRKGVLDTRYRLREANGQFRWFRARAFPRVNGDSPVDLWYGSLEDIEDQVRAKQALQESEERYRLAALASHDIIWEASLRRDHVAWSDAAATVLGYPEVALGTSRAWWLDRVHADDREAVLTVLNTADLSLTYWTDEFRFLAADGTYLTLAARGYVVRDVEGEPDRIIGSLQDVTSQRQYEETLRWAAHHDALTGLPNRLLFAQRLDSTLLDAKKSGTSVELVTFDVDRFNSINDSLGHHAGDALLREIGTRLIRHVPTDATVARLGGDEFALILSHNDVGPALVQDILAEVCVPMMYEGRQIDVSLSGGIAVALEDGRSAEELHKSADLALFAAKRDGTGQVRRFTRNLREASEREVEMLSDARSALQEDRIFPFYQPKVCLRTGACIGFEALLRWHDHGLRTPGELQAALDDPGMSVAITDRMLDRIIEDVLSWQGNGLEVGRIAINGSAGDFKREDFADRILGRLDRARLSPSILELEVTESVFVGQHAENVSHALEALSAAGVSIALDDFGTGYASLTHLKQFPVHTLKIDRSFISKLGMIETQDDAIIGAVIDLARNLGIKTVAEGIETPAQLGQLMVKRCDVGQGFLLGKPLGASQMTDVISHWDAQAVLAKAGLEEWGAAARSFHHRRFMR
jgi:diguanylate cyclase (GGDEF)-like protein/PAS domain S-box-containing protein